MENFEAYYIVMEMAEDNQQCEELCELGRFLFDQTQAKLLFGPCTKTRDEFFIFIEPYLRAEFFGILHQFRAEMTVEDIRMEILTGDYRNEVFDYVFNQTENRAILDTYRKANLTQDLVLDMIRKKGIGNISDFELAILKCA